MPWKETLSLIESTLKWVDIVLFPLIVTVLILSLRASRISSVSLKLNTLSPLFSPKVVVLYWILFILSFGEVVLEWDYNTWWY